MKSKQFRQDRSPVIPQKPKIKNNLNIRDREFTEKQKEFLKIALDKNTKMMIVSGVAGTTKTWLAVYCALKLLNDKKVSDMIYIRGIVESADAKMGYLPGESDAKMAPYVQPLFDKLDELLPRCEVDALIKDKRVNSIPVGFLRGLNFNARAIICDECQDLSFKELVTVITRIGEYSKVFIIGDPSQADIGLRSGFQKLYDVFNDDESKANGIYTFKFNEEDCLRSGLVKFITQKIKNTIKN